MTIGRYLLGGIVLLASCGGTDDVDASLDGGGRADAGRVDGGGDVPDGGGDEIDGSRDEDAGRGDAGGIGPDGGAGGARAWIIEHFASVVPGGAPELRGAFTSRTSVETPTLVRDATGCCAKYAFDVREATAPDLREVGFVDVTITDLVSGDAFGGGIQSSGAPGLVLFLSHVTIDPGWPEWIGYATTNYDGIVLDGSSAIYAEDLTIRDWNADGAIDNKAPISQFVRLRIEGRGNRAMRYWGAGPHYLVDSHLSNEGGLGEGSVLWFSDCDTAVVRIFASTFDGSDTVPPSAISCDNGADPELVYLPTDPRTTGEMHEMFTP